MAEAPEAPVELVVDKMTLSTKLLQVLTAGDVARVVGILNLKEPTNVHVAINVPATAPQPARLGTSSCLLGVTSNGNTALHLVASKGHAELVTLICERAPSLVATRNRALDTPLHCAARGGHREVAAFLLSTMLNSGVEEAAALQATNRLGDTALHVAVQNGHEGVVDLFMEMTPQLASVTSDDGVSALYMAATANSAKMVGLLIHALPDGTPSPASSAGRKGRTALHVAATISKEMVEGILKWEPEGPDLLTRVDMAGESPLHFAVAHEKIDVVDQLLEVDSHLACMSDKDGLSPVHLAATDGSTRMVDKLIKRCPEYYELVDDEGMNLLHFAVKGRNDKVVRYICQNERFSVLLNAKDFKGNTPLHLAVKNGYPPIVSILLQSKGVEINITNRDGLTARDLAHIGMPRGRLYHFMEPSVLVFYSLCWAGASNSLDIIDTKKKDDYDKNEWMEKDYTKGTVISALITSVTFAAAFTVPGGFIADNNADAGTVLHGRQFAYRAFVVSDTIAFLCSILTTGFLIYGGLSEVPRNRRSRYIIMSNILAPMAVQSMICAFMFAFHLVLGIANRKLLIFVYVASLASVLIVSLNTWAPLHVYEFAKAMLCRVGWKGLLYMHKRPSGPIEVFWRWYENPLAMSWGDRLMYYSFVPPFSWRSY